MRRLRTPLARRIRRLQDANPDLPVRLIADALRGIEELDAGQLEPVDWSIGSSPPSSDAL